MDDGKSIRYKDLYALFEQILEKSMRLEQRDWSESPVKVWVNTFKVFLDEFMTEYKPLEGTIGRVRTDAIDFIIVRSEGVFTLVSTAVHNVRVHWKASRQMLTPPTSIKQYKHNRTVKWKDGWKDKGVCLTTICCNMNMAQNQMYSKNESTLQAKLIVWVQ